MLLLLLVAPALADSQNKAISDDQIRQKLIEQSIASYSGTCACPFNVARNGSRCGGRSAWSRPGGAAPLCFPDDVTDKMVADYRRQHHL